MKEVDMGEICSMHERKKNKNEYKTLFENKPEGKGQLVKRRCIHSKTRYSTVPGDSEQKCITQWTNNL